MALIIAEESQSEVPVFTITGRNADHPIHRVPGSAYQVSQSHESLINMKCFNLTTSGLMLVVKCCMDPWPDKLPAEPETLWRRER